MKYIRTEDGIFKVLKSNIHKDKYFIIDENDPITYLDKNDVKIADTIEELCDEFVVVYKNFEKPLVHDSDKTNKEQLKELKDILETATIYGAIWTDKGLIYVAKMNEKGKLALI